MSAKKRRRQKNTGRTKSAVYGQQTAIVQMKLALKEIDQINRSKKEARQTGEAGIHSYEQMRHATSASRNFIAFVSKQFGIEQVHKFTLEHYESYIDDMIKRKLSMGHIRNVETGLKQLQKGFNQRQERIGYKPVLFVPEKRLVAYKTPTPKNRSYSTDECDLIFKHATTEAKVGIELMRELGLRVREAANVRVEHFKKEGDTYVLNIESKEGAGITKGGRYRYLPVPNHFTLRLEQLLQGKEATDPIVKMTTNSLRSAVRDACKKGGVKQDGRGTHGFRHQYARTRARQLMTEQERNMMDRVLENMNDGKPADYGILSDEDQHLFATMKNKMDQIHSEIGHGKNRYHLAMVYLKKDEMEDDLDV